MRELLRSNDAVLLSFAQHVLAESGIDVLLADQHVSIMEGSIGVFPRRLMVPADDAARARRALVEAGLSAELTDTAS